MLHWKTYVGANGGCPPSIISIGAINKRNEMLGLA